MVASACYCRRLVAASLLLLEIRGFVYGFSCGNLLSLRPTTLSTRFKHTADVPYRIIVLQLDSSKRGNLQSSGSIKGVENTNSNAFQHTVQQLSGYNTDGKLFGTLVLLTVPLSWGTYSPVVRYLYAIDPPVPGFVFSACYYMVAAVTTLALAQWQSRQKTFAEKDDPMLKTTTNNKSIIPIQGGIELGSYLFVANCLQVVGLQTVEAERAGFLVQVTTVMVPLTEALLAGNLYQVSTKTFLACVVAFVGLFIMGLDGEDNHMIFVHPNQPWFRAASSFTQGDCLILGAALLYTLHVVRLGIYTRQTTPMKLAAAKATTETFQSVGLIIGLVGLSTAVQPQQAIAENESSSILGFAAAKGQEISDFLMSFAGGIEDGSLPMSALLSAFGAIFWTGWVTCAYTIWAQSFGQSRVSPSNANLIYTFQPIFTSLFAWLLLGETMGPLGFLGGAIAASAVSAVADEESKTTSWLGGGRSSSASLFVKNFETSSVGKVDHTFYGIRLSNNVWDAPSSQFIALVVVVIAFVFQPKIFRQRRSLFLAYWIAIWAIVVAAPETTLIPLLTNIINTRSAYPYMIVIPHCIVSAATYRKRHGDKVHYLQSLVLSFFLYGFGGSIVSDLLMGLPATALSHSRIIPCYLIGWSLVWLCPWDLAYRSVTDPSTPALGLVLKGCEAVDAVTTPMGRVSRSARELRNKVTAPVVAGLLAGVGGGGVRHMMGEPTSNVAALESSFWKTLSYSVLWWWLAVHRCVETGDNTFWLRSTDRARNHCDSYNGSDQLRVIIVSAHTIWVLLAELGLVRGHPLVWICRTIVERLGSKMVHLMRLGPSAEEVSDATQEQDSIGTSDEAIRRKKSEKAKIL